MKTITIYSPEGNLLREYSHSQLESIDSHAQYSKIEFVTEKNKVVRVVGNFIGIIEEE